MNRKAGMSGGRKIRILHIITRLEHGGPPIALLNLIERLDKGKFQCAIATGFTGEPEKDMIPHARRKNIEVLTIPHLVRDISPASDLMALYELIAVLRRQKADIVHCHTSKAGFIGRLAAKIAGRSVILYSPHGTILKGYFAPLKTRFFTALDRLAALLTDRILCLSQVEIMEYLEAGIGSLHQYCVLHNGIDVAQMEERRLDNLRMRERLGLGREDFICVTVGRLVPVKGYPFLIDAMGKLAQTIPNVKLVIAGDGSEREKLKKQVLELALDDRVLFLGLREDIPEILSCGDLFLLSSVNEGFGLVLLEAMAFKLPIVATRVGGVPEVVKDGETGLLIPSQDPQSFVNAVLKIYRNRDWGRDLGLAGYERVKRKFDLEVIVQKLENLYVEVLQGDSQSLITKVIDISKHRHPGARRDPGSA